MWINAEKTFSPIFPAFSTAFYGEPLKPCESECVFVFFLTRFKEKKSWLQIRWNNYLHFCCTDITENWNIFYWSFVLQDQLSLQTIIANSKFKLVFQYRVGLAFCLLILFTVIIVGVIIIPYLVEVAQCDDSETRCPPDILPPYADGENYCCSLNETCCLNVRGFGSCCLQSSTCCGGVCCSETEQCCGSVCIPSKYECCSSGVYCGESLRCCSTSTTVRCCHQYFGCSDQEPNCISPSSHVALNYWFPIISFASFQYNLNHFDERWIKFISTSFLNIDDIEFKTDLNKSIILLFIFYTYKYTSWFRVLKQML